MLTNFKTQIADMFLDFFNNYLTIAKFAEHNEISEEFANAIINAGRIYHEARAQEAQEQTDV